MPCRYAYSRHELAHVKEAHICQHTGHMGPCKVRSVYSIHVDTCILETNVQKAPLCVAFSHISEEGFVANADLRGKTSVLSWSEHAKDVFCRAYQANSGICARGYMFAWACSSLITLKEIQWLKKKRSHIYTHIHIHTHTYQNISRKQVVMIHHLPFLTSHTVYRLPCLSGARWHAFWT